MGHYFNISCIVELQENLSGTIIVVDEKKYKEMRVLFMNHSDDELRERGVINKSINAIGGFRDVI